MMPTEQSFLKDVANHQMTIESINGVHRFIRFKRPGTGNMFFDIVTWPGYLAYSGDMGCYVFSRLTDMFEFFRSDSDSAYLKQKGLTLGINRSYWGEKLQAVDRSDGYKEYSPDKFRRAVCERRIQWIREDGLSKPERRELWEAIDSEVLNYADDGHESAQRAAMEFNHKTEFSTFEFSDFWEHDLTDYSYRFTWCCYALAWAIKQFDEEVTS